MSVIAKNLTADGAIHTGSCEFYGATLFASTVDGDATVVIYDNTSAAGTVIQHLAATQEFTTAHAALPYRVGCTKGIYVDITGTNASVTVYYRPELVG